MRNVSNAECGMRNVECGMRNDLNVELGMWNAEFDVPVKVGI